MNIYGLTNYNSYQNILNSNYNTSQNSYVQTTCWNTQASSSNNSFFGTFNQLDNIASPTGIDFNLIGQLIMQILFPPLDPAEQAKIELRENLHTELNKYAAARDEMLANSENMTPEELRSKLNSINQVEKVLITHLKNTYPEDSMQAKALNSLLNVNEAEQELFDIKEKLHDITTAIVDFASQLANMDPGNPQAQVIQARINSLQTIAAQLEEKQAEAQEKYQQEQSAYVSNTMMCPRKDKKYIADIRADQFHSQSVLHETRVESLTEKIQAIKEYLENPNITDDIRIRLEMRLELAKQDFRTESSDLRTSKFNEFLMNIMTGF